MDETLPLLTIITPSFNRAGFISNAVDSALDQDYPVFEHIIVDGGSTDETLNVLRRYPHLRVVSEPDRGMYDALNKGVHQAGGQVIGFLNTDDRYEPHIFRSVMQVMMSHPDISAVVGGATIFREPSTSISGLPAIIATFKPITRGELFYRLTRGVSIFNAWFFRREVFNQLGEFNIRYRASADRDFLIRFAIRGLQHICLPHTVYHYGQHAASMTMSGGGNAESSFVFEDRLVAESYLGQPHLGNNPNARKSIQRWHSQITTDQALLALSRVDILKVGKYAYRGLRYNPLGWGPIFITNLVSSIFRRINQLDQRKTSSL